MGGSFIMIRPTLLLSSQQQRETNCVCSQRHLVEERRSYLLAPHNHHTSVQHTAAAAQPMNYLRQHTVRVFQFGLLVRVFLLTSYIHTTHMHSGHDKIANVRLCSTKVSLSPSRVHLEDVSLRDFRSQIYLCTLEIIFSLNHNIHKSSSDLCFWTSDHLIETVQWNPSIKGSEAQKQWPDELL